MKGVSELEQMLAAERAERRLHEATQRGLAGLRDALATGAPDSVAGGVRSAVLGAAEEPRRALTPTARYVGVAVRGPRHPRFEQLAPAAQGEPRAKPPQLAAPRFVAGQGHGDKPARLRMNRLVNVATNKVDF